MKPISPQVETAIDINHLTTYNHASLNWIHEFRFMNGTLSHDYSPNHLDYWIFCVLYVIFSAINWRQLRYNHPSFRIENLLWSFHCCGNIGADPSFHNRAPARKMDLPYNLSQILSLYLIYITYFSYMATINRVPM